MSLSACSADAPLTPHVPQSKGHDPLRWPQPPLPTRIEFVGTLASERDVGQSPGLADALNTFLTGEETRENFLVQPMDVAVSNDGQRIFVSDLGANTVYAFDLAHSTMEKVVSTNRVWARPFGLALDAEDNLYVVEQENKTITVVAPNGTIVSQFSHRSFERPTDIAVDDRRGWIYVVDGSRQKSPNHLVYVFDLEGRFIRTVGKGKGTGPGYLLFPTYVAVSADGMLYVADTVNSRISVFDDTGTFKTQIGKRGDVLGHFDKPKGLAFDPQGNLYVADSGWSNVQVFDGNGEALMFFAERGSEPGSMSNPTGLDIDTSGRIYVADYLNHRVDVYRIIADQPTAK